MSAVPKYLLKYGKKEIESDDLDSLTTFAKRLTEYYEIFRIYRAVHAPERKKFVYTSEEIGKAINLYERGYSRDIVARQMGMSRFYVDKILGPQHAMR